jgi:hypothetical protein
VVVVLLEELERRVCFIDLNNPVEVAHRGELRYQLKEDAGFTERVRFDRSLEYGGLERN